MILRNFHVNTVLIYITNLLDQKEVISDFIPLFLSVRLSSICFASDLKIKLRHN